MTDLYSEGDRVRATHKRTGEVHKFEVRSSTDSRLTSTTGLYFHSPVWNFEKLASPLPTKAGLYKPYEASGIRHLLLTTTGEWFWVFFEGGTKDWPVAKVAKTWNMPSYADTMTPVYLYND